MIYSMTGYGRGEVQDEHRKYTFEIKSINHRYCEIVLRLPRNYHLLEERIRKVIQSYVHRGRIDGYLTVETVSTVATAIKVDKELASSYYKAMKELSSELGLNLAVDIATIINLPQVIVFQEEEIDWDQVWQQVQHAVEEACRQLTEMRAAEGRRLVNDIEQRLQTIEEHRQAIAARVPRLLEEHRQRLRQRVEELLGGMTEILAERLEQEVVIYAERTNISEELVRLSSHLVEMHHTLTKATGQAVGRKLDFLLQEMLREVNTMATKAGDAYVSQRVVEIKSELEKIREQVQNIE